MLTIKNIRFKNFMSYGAAWTEVDLIRDQLSVISGRNGGGKCLTGDTHLRVIMDEETYYKFIKFVNSSDTVISTKNGKNNIKID